MDLGSGGFGIRGALLWSGGVDSWASAWWSSDVVSAMMVSILCSCWFKLKLVGFVAARIKDLLGSIRVEPECKSWVFCDCMSCFQTRFSGRALSTSWGLNLGTAKWR